MERLALFDEAPRAAAAARTTPGPKAVSFVPSPSWFASAVLDRYFRDLDSSSVVLEPTAGDGAWLAQIDPNVFAFGVELDPVLAQHARDRSGREVIVGDVLTVRLPYAPTHVIGNPPFSTAFLDALLHRFARILPDGGRIGLLVPAYFHQTSTRIAQIAEQWSIAVDMIPRDIFPGFNLPLTFTQYTKEAQRRLIGLAFYHETAEFRRFPEAYQRLLTRADRNVWVAAILEALRQLGGRGSVSSICDRIRGHQPTRVTTWRASVRKWLQQGGFVRLGHDDWALPAVGQAA